MLIVLSDKDDKSETNWMIDIGLGLAGAILIGVAVFALETDSGYAERAREFENARAAAERARMAALNNKL